MRVKQVFQHHEANLPPIVLKSLLSEQLVSVLATVHVVGAVVLDSHSGFGPREIQVPVRVIHHHVKVHDWWREPMGEDYEPGKSFSW